MAKADLKIDWATHAAAKYACENWHYARRVPVGKLLKLGVWEDRKYIGVLVFSPGAAGVGYLAKGFGWHPASVCELQRVALRDHKTEVTRIISIAIRRLKKSCPGLNACISYADPYQGHEGTIYKAGNWFQWGTSGKTKAYRYADGVELHARSVDESGYVLYRGEKSKSRKPSEAIEVVNYPPKKRFLYPLSDEGKLLIERLRDKQAMADTLGTAAGQHRPSRSNTEAA